MTDKLRTLMSDRADSATFEMPDLDLLTRSGERLRRRRTASVVAGLVVVAAVGAGVTAGAVDHVRGDDRVEVAEVGPGVLAVDTYSWSSGSVLHAGATRLDVGHPIAFYVRTAVGYVFADGDGSVYSVDGAGVRQVGAVSADQPRLVSDPQGDLVAWVDPTGERPAFVVLDQSTGEVTSDDSHTHDVTSPYVDAIDGTMVYQRDDRGTVAVDAGSGEVRVLDAAGAISVAGAAAGLVARQLERGVVVGPDLEDGTLVPGLLGPEVHLSPDGRHATGEISGRKVFDVADGGVVRLDLDRGFVYPVEWLDDDTLVVFATRLPTVLSDAELFTCSVPAGDCELVDADLGTAVEFSDDGGLQAVARFASPENVAEAESLTATDSAG